jgi:hypothetical protein
MKKLVVVFATAMLALALVAAASADVSFSGHVYKQNGALCTAGCTGVVYWDGNPAITYMGNVGLAGSGGSCLLPVPANRWCVYHVPWHSGNRNYHVYGRMTTSVRGCYWFSPVIPVLNVQDGDDRGPFTTVVNTYACPEGPSRQLPTLTVLADLH